MSTLINADFSRIVLVRDADNPWRASPAAGVERKLLDRVGDEVARATSIVRYAPGSHFAPHTHELGEEFLVLDGVFQDESGDYPAGTYVRNPPGSRHTPASVPGCTIFVKLRQFARTDVQAVRVAVDALDHVEVSPGATSGTLHEDAREQVLHLRLAPAVCHHIPAAGGIEVLALSGAVDAAGHALNARDWLRCPAGMPVELRAGEQPSTCWVKMLTEATTDVS